MTLLHLSFQINTLNTSQSYILPRVVLVVQSPVVSSSFRPHGPQHARLPCPPLSLRICSVSCPLSQGCHPTISSSVVPFSSCPQSCQASVSFSNELVLCIRWPKYWTSGSVSVLPMNSQAWFPLGLTGLISLLSRGLSRVFSSATIWEHQFFSAQPSLWSNSHTCTWLQEKPQLWLYKLVLQYLANY